MTYLLVYIAIILTTNLIIFFIHGINVSDAIRSTEDKLFDIRQLLIVAGQRQRKMLDTRKLFGVAEEDEKDS